MRRRLIWFPGTFGVSAIPDLGDACDERAPMAAPDPAPAPLARAVLVGQGARGRFSARAALTAIVLMAALFAVVAAIA